MKVPKGTMIGTVLATAVKAIFVGAFVGVRQLVVEPIVSAVAVVFVIVGKCGHHGYAQHQHGGGATKASARKLATSSRWGMAGSPKASTRRSCGTPRRCSTSWPDAVHLLRGGIAARRLHSKA